MLKHVMAVAAVSALALTSALAQTSTQNDASPSTSSPPAATSPSTPNASPSASPGASSTTTPPSASSSTTSTPSASSTSSSSTASTAPAPAKFITQQSADQFLASKFKGTDVIGTDDKKIGDVSDILFDKNQKVLAYIVGVGGFLGIGQKDVALDPAAFQMVAGNSATDYKLRLSMTKDELKNAPTFEPYKEARPTTTSSNSSTRPMGTPAPAPKQ